MKKFLLCLICLFAAITVKATDYEIATVLSSPYGIFSTFTVIGDATVRDLIVGAYSRSNQTNYGPNNLTIHTPMQEANIIAGGVHFGGNVNVGRDFDLYTQSQNIDTLTLTKLATKIYDGSAWVDLVEGTSAVLQFNTSMNITNTLNTAVLSANNLTIDSNFTTPKLFAHTVQITNGSNTFTFPPMRSNEGSGGYLGVNLTAQSPGVNTKGGSMNCGAGLNKHFYGPWITCPSNSPCQASTCSSDICSNSLDETADPCIQTRQITYTAPTATDSDIDMKPNISEQRTYYQKCSYIADIGACGQPDYAEGEELYKQTLESTMYSCGEYAPVSCGQLCGLYNKPGENGCQASARKCYFKSDREFGQGCGLSGWEQGSGLECTDSYRRVIYTVYSCPQGSDYFHNIETTTGASTQTFYQYREVTCVYGSFTSEDTKQYCDKQFVTLDVGGV